MTASELELWVNQLGAKRIFCTAGLIWFFFALYIWPVFSQKQRKRLFDDNSRKGIIFDYIGSTLFIFLGISAFWPCIDIHIMAWEYQLTFFSWTGVLFEVISICYAISFREQYQYIKKYKNKNKKLIKFKYIICCFCIAILTILYVMIFVCWILGME